MNTTDLNLNEQGASVASSFDQISNLIPVARGEEDAPNLDDEDKDKDKDGNGVDDTAGKDPKKDDIQTPPDLTTSNNDDEEEEEEDDKGGDNDDDVEDSIIVSKLLEKYEDVELPDATFETEEEAVEAVTEAIANSARLKGAEEGIVKLFKQYPDVEKLTNHLSKGQTLKTFLKEVQTPSFLEIDLENAKEEEKLNIIRQASKDKGMDDDDIEDLIETIRDKDIVDDRATKSQNYLKNKYSKEIEAEKEAERKETEKQIKAQKETQEKLKNILESGDLGVAKLNKEQTKIIEAFISGQEEDGSSTRNKAWKSLTPEKLLFLDYLIATDFKDINKLGKTDPKETKVVKSVKIKKSSEGRVSLRTNSSKTTSDAPLDVKKLFHS